MHFDMCREPKSDHSYFKKSEYQAYFGAAKIGDSLSALQISFQTSGSLRGSTFTGYLLPSSFDDMGQRCRISRSKNRGLRRQHKRRSSARLTEKRARGTWRHPARLKVFSNGAIDSNSALNAQLTLDPSCLLQVSLLQRATAEFLG